MGDWEALFAEAFAALTPDGWLESHESPARWDSDETLDDSSALAQWGKIFHNFGNSINKRFDIAETDIQRKAMEAAGFVDIKEHDYKVRLRITPPITNPYNQPLT